MPALEIDIKTEGVEKIWVQLISLVAWTDACVAGPAIPTRAGPTSARTLSPRHIRLRGEAAAGLAEKDIDWESRYIDILANEQLTPAYLALNPMGVVPTLVHDGSVIR